MPAWISGSLSPAKCYQSLHESLGEISCPSQEYHASPSTRCPFTFVHFSIGHLLFCTKVSFLYFLSYHYLKKNFLLTPYCIPGWCQRNQVRVSTHTWPAGSWRIEERADRWNAGFTSTCSGVEDGVLGIMARNKRSIRRGLVMG